MTDIGGKTDDGEDDIGLRSDGQRGLSEVGPHVEERPGLRDGPSEDGESIASFDKVSTHGAAHNAGADPANAGV